MLPRPLLLLLLLCGPGYGDILASPPLVFPYGGTIKLLVGYALPVPMPGRTVVYGQNVQFQYALPQNASFFSDYFNAGRRRRRRQSDGRARERSLFYQLAEHELERRGAPGRECLLRSICEAAAQPLLQPHNGLVGEVLHLLLTPDGSSDVEYRQAADSGRRSGDCLEAYPGCPRGLGILDRVSALFSDQLVL